jgi:hypothetical protein
MLAELGATDDIVQPVRAELATVSACRSKSLTK